MPSVHLKPEPPSLPNEAISPIHYLCIYLYSTGFYACRGVEVIAISHIVDLAITLIDAIWNNCVWSTCYRPTEWTFLKLLYTLLYMLQNPRRSLYTTRTQTAKSLRTHETSYSSYGMHTQVDSTCKSWYYTLGSPGERATIIIRWKPESSSKFDPIPIPMSTSDPVSGICFTTQRWRSDIDRALGGTYWLQICTIHAGSSMASTIGSECLAAGLSVDDCICFDHRNESSSSRGQQIWRCSVLTVEQYHRSDPDCRFHIRDIVSRITHERVHWRISCFSWSLSLSEQPNIPYYLGKW